VVVGQWTTALALYFAASGLIVDDGRIGKESKGSDLDDRRRSCYSCFLPMSQTHHIPFQHYCCRFRDVCECTIEEITSSPFLTFAPQMRLYQFVLLWKGWAEHGSKQLFLLELFCLNECVIGNRIFCAKSGERSISDAYRCASTSTPPRTTSHIPCELRIGVSRLFHELC
jgi:hypothetical protein